MKTPFLNQYQRMLIAQGTCAGSLFVLLLAIKKLLREVERSVFILLTKLGIKVKL